MWFKYSCFLFTFRGWLVFLLTCNSCYAASCINSYVPLFPGKTSGYGLITDSLVTGAEPGSDTARLLKQMKLKLDSMQYAGAEVYANRLLAIAPQNYQALFAKALVYEQSGNDDSVVYYYEKSIHANSNVVTPCYNLAAFYFNKANTLFGQINQLGASEADEKRYKQLKAQMYQLYSKAQPWLVKAHELSPGDQQINRVLKQVNSFLENEK